MLTLVPSWHEGKFVDQKVSLLLISVALALGGCANRQQPVEFNAATAKVVSIALLEPGVPNRPALAYAGPASNFSTVAGPLFGIVGAVASLPNEMSAHERIQSGFAAVVASRPLNVREELASGLEKALADQGYKVVRVPTQRSVKGDTQRIEDLRETYPATLAAGQDAILDVSLYVYGYGVRYPHQPYRPMVSVGYRLVRPGSGEVLMRKGYTYANSSPMEQPDDTFRHLLDE